MAKKRVSRNKYNPFNRPVMVTEWVIKRRRALFEWLRSEGTPMKLQDVCDFYEQHLGLVNVSTSLASYDMQAIGARRFYLTDKENNYIYVLGPNEPDFTGSRSDAELIYEELARRVKGCMLVCYAMREIVVVQCSHSSGKYLDQMIRLWHLPGFILDTMSSDHSVWLMCASDKAAELVKQELDLCLAAGEAGVPEGFRDMQFRMLKKFWEARDLRHERLYQQDSEARRTAKAQLEKALTEAKQAAEDRASRE